MENLTFCIKFNTFPIPISDCLTMQQSTVLTFLSFFPCFLTKHSYFFLGILSEVKSKISPPSAEFSNYFPVAFPVSLWVLKTGRFPRLIQVSLSKGLCLNMCCAIRYLNCSLAWETEDPSIAFVALISVWAKQNWWKMKGFTYFGEKRGQIIIS